MNRALIVLLSLLVVAGIIGGAAYYRYRHPLVATSRPTTTTAPVTQPATVEARAKPKPHPTTQILDILRAKDPKYPTTQRLDDSLDLKYAARILLSDPVYLDVQGNLWITRPDAPADFNFIKAASSDTATHVVRDVVVFVLWDATDNGKWLPHLVVKPPQSKGYELVDYDGRRPLADPHHFDWSRALALQGPPGEPAHIVVPTATGACAFAFGDDPDAILKSHHQLIDPKSKDAADRAVQLVMDTQGVIAYVTNAAGTHGEKGLARFAPKPNATEVPRPYAWSPLSGWADQIVYLIPLLDGSVLQIASIDNDEKDKVAFSLNTLTQVTIDQKRVYQLIDQLSDPASEKRDEAFKTLTTFGPSIAPLMEKVIEQQPVEAQIRIRQLLKNKITPSLGSMSLVDGCMRVVNRLPDGGIVFYSEAGVSIPRFDDTPAYVAPAWLSLRPGRAAELLPATLVADLQPGKQTIIPWSLNDYIVLDPVQGPEWFIGNHLEPLLHKEHRQFNHFTGIDSTGRWIFQTKPNAPKLHSTTAPSTTQDSALSTQDLALILDPHLPDPTPRLPGWLLPRSVGKVGWGKNHWPVIYMDAKPNPVPWALGESEWRVVDEKKESVLTTPPAPTPPPAPTTTRASTHASTTQSITQASVPSPQDFLLVTPDGTQYYDGRQTLTVIRPDGARLTWSLPKSALGTGKPTLLGTRDGRLFLFNEPGRVVRIRPTPDSDEPFTVEAVFTRGVPSDSTPLRIWLDPADRICIAHDQSRITILFPNGRIPPAIAQKMRPEDFPPDEP